MPEPLDYQIPYASHGRPPAVASHVRLFIGAFGAWAVIVGVMAFVPRFEQIFANLRAPLPWNTKLVLTVSRAIVNGAWLFTLAIPIAIVALGILIDRVSPTPRASQVYERIMMLLLMVAMAAFAVFVFASVDAPMLSAIETISGP